MKIFKKLLIALCFLTTNCIAQTTEPKEQFINSVYLTFVDSSFTQYYLTDNCSKLILSSAKIKVDFAHFCPDSIFQQIYLKSEVDTLTETWQCNNLTKSKCISSDLVYTFVQDKTLLQEKKVYTFSKPIFSDNCEYAVIEMSYFCGPKCAYGCTVLFKKVNGRWTKLTETNCWVS